MDTGLVCSLVVHEVSLRAVGGKEELWCHLCVANTQSVCLDTKMEGLALWMGSATQKRLSPLLIILISWNYKGKCNNSWSSLKKN